MLYLTCLMPDRADNDDARGALFGNEAASLSTRTRNLIGQGLRGLYGATLEEEPSERIAELIEALISMEPTSKASSAG